MKRKHILKIEEAVSTLHLEYSEDIRKLLRYLETGDNGCPWTFSHTRECCGYAGCRED